ncbi:MAG: hypothetical protein RIC51_05195 [Erythrobacter sp.]|uniref:hypothetical protein n=1 Tax=Erythrobacter sp. TaxID=1042 RepID=UPI0032ED43E5
MNHEITRLRAELEAAQDDLELAERMRTAKTRLSQLTDALAAAEEAEKEAQAAAAKAAREERLRGISNMRVTDVTSQASQSAQGGLLHRVWQIDWDAPKWDQRVNASPIGQHTMRGFGALPGNVMEYLLDEAPEQIPAKIMALAPGDPRAAMSEYLDARQRGYTRQPAGAAA